MLCAAVRRLSSDQIRCPDQVRFIWIGVARARADMVKRSATWISSALVARLAAPIGIEWQIHEQRLVRALRTGLAWANVTIDSNPTEYALVIVIIRGRVPELLRVFQLAAK